MLKYVFYCAYLTNCNVLVFILAVSHCCVDSQFSGHISSGKFSQIITIPDKQTSLTHCHSHSWDYYLIVLIASVSHWPYFLLHGFHSISKTGFSLISGCTCVLFGTLIDKNECPDHQYYCILYDAVTVSRSNEIRNWQQTSLNLQTQLLFMIITLKFTQQL